MLLRSQTDVRAMFLWLRVKDSGDTLLRYQTNVRAMFLWLHVKSMPSICLSDLELTLTLKCTHDMIRLFTHTGTGTGTSACHVATKPSTWFDSAWQLN